VVVAYKPDVKKRPPSKFLFVVYNPDGDFVSKLYDAMPRFRLG
jgi:hypothetical protein